MTTKLISDPMSATQGRSRTMLDFVELSKPRISVMVLLTVAVAGLISLSAATQASVWNLVHAMIGLFLVSASGCAMNQYLERYVDWLMPRTAKRPLPDLRLSSLQVASFGAITFGTGVAWLVALVNWQTAAVAIATWVLYVWIYTPLKLRTWTNTYIGAVAGAAPVLVGSTAVCDGNITLAAWLLFVVLFIWQFPHFMAIAWIYRDDYERGNVKMTSTVDESGRLTAWHAIGFSILLIPVSVFALWPGSAIQFVMTLSVLGLAIWYLVASLRFARDINNTTARRLFHVSLLYLPAYLVVLSIAEFI